MAIRDDCVLWNQFENGTLASQIGVNGVEVGTLTFNVGKFNNGMFTNNTANYAKFNERPAVTAGALGIWFVAEENSSGIANGTSRSIVRMDSRQVGDPQIDLWMLFFNKSGGGVERFIMTFRNNSGATVQFIINKSFLIGDEIHFFVVWDKGGIDGGANIERFYIDGTLEGSSNVDSVPDWSFGNPLLHVGMQDFAISNPIYNTLDNIKLYSKISIDNAWIASVIANKDIEGFIPDAVTGVDASDGTYTTHVNISWDSISWVDDYKVYRSDDDVVYAELSDWQVGTSYNDTSAIAGTTYYYKVEARTDNGGTGDLSASDSGYRAIRVQDITCDKNKPQVLILSEAIDIYDKISNIIKVQEKKTFRRDKLIVNSITQRVKNFDNYFSVDNPASIFSNIRWRFDTFKIINQAGETIWDGIIQDIVRDHKSKYAIIKSTDELYKFQKYKVVYTSSDWESPAEAFKNLSDDVGFTQYNEKAVQDSINQQEDNDCYIKCFFTKNDDCSFQQAIEKLGEIGCADVYSHKNEVYYQHWQPFTGGVKISLDVSDLLEAPIITSAIKDIYNDYRIGYEGNNNVPATDGDNNDIGSVSRDTYGVHDLPELNCSAGQQIVFKDKTSAVYIGECYIKRTHKNIDDKNKIPYPLSVIKFSIKETEPDWIDLRSFLNLTLPSEGWVDKTFEIFGTIIDYDINKIQIIAYEVDI